jgi:uncharacterized membrane protein YccF (DUF307 family)
MMTGTIPSTGAFPFPIPPAIEPNRVMLLPGMLPRCVQQRNISPPSWFAPARANPYLKGAMSLLSLILNVLWIAFGGLWMAAGWVIAGIIMAITIIGLPWTPAAFNIALYTLLPFGQKAVSRADYSGQQDIGTGPLGVLGNLLWLVLAGWWLALAHLVTALLLAVSVIGIPFAWAHLKLAGLALWPIGKMIVPADDAPLPYRRR